MPIGEITGYIDVAQLVLYAFWLFFFGLIYYLRKEDKREGYPLVADPAVPSEQHKTRMEGFPPMPDPKVFRLADGSTRVAPREDRDPDGLKAEPMESWPGSPLLPTGNPMRDGVGPAAYAQRPDEPEKTLHGKPRMAPLRLAVDFHVEARDPDPRGMDVVGADGRSAGEIVDIWIDRSEPQIRYLEVSVHGSAPAPAVSDAEEGQSPPPPKNRRVLLPIHFTRIDGQRRQVRVKSILAGQFADVPVLRNPDQVTQLEEDRITAYYGSGHLYALADRQGAVAVNEHEFEPVPGLPEDLPVDEVILWQGAPDWRVLARRVFRLRLLGGYFILLLAVRISSALLTGEALAPTLVSLALLTGLGLCAAGLFTLYAWLTARSTLYTVTSKRLVMRFGIAIQLTINLPFTRIQSAAVRAYRDGSGDIPLVLDDSHRVSYVVMWPHVRPWHFRHPEPMLRGLPDAKSVAEIVADTASGIVPAPPEPVIRPARHANNRQRVPLTLGEAT